VRPDEPWGSQSLIVVRRNSQSWGGKSCKSSEPLVRRPTKLWQQRSRQIRNRRAGCGRSASPVRRGERGKTMSRSYLYPLFCAAKSNFKGPMVLFRVRGTRGLGKNTGRDCPGPICGSFGCFSPNPAELTTTDQREIDCRRQLRRSEQRESKSTEGE
jgi:hypothetical protein